MKKTTLILIAAFALVFSACKTQQTVTEPPITSGNGLGEEIALPCVDESMDDADYYRAMGTAENVNQQNARDAAFEAAKSMLRKRLGGLVNGLSSDYSRIVAGDAQQTKVAGIIESEMYTVVEKMLNDAGKTCEKMYQNKSGNYVSYIAIKVSKAEMIDQTSTKLSANEELEIEFNRDQFRKFSEKKMKEMEGYKGE